MSRHGPTVATNTKGESNIVTSDGALSWYVARREARGDREIMGTLVSAPAERLFDGLAGFNGKTCGDQRSSHPPDG